MSGEAQAKWTSGVEETLGGELLWTLRTVHPLDEASKLQMRDGCDDLTAACEAIAYPLRAIDWSSGGFIHG